jgi:hypothetical protein
MGGHRGTIDGEPTQKKQPGVATRLLVTKISLIEGKNGSRA